MSVGKQALKYTAAAVAVAAIIIVGSTTYLGVGLGTTATSSTTGAQGATAAQLAIQLTDPPIVPRGTTSLNLTYTSIALLAGEPASNGQQTTTTVSLTPKGGSATVDLLSLQNISQTIALTPLPNGSTIYSFTLSVTSINIDVNGTISPVTLATGGSSLTVTLARPAPLDGNSIALLQLNPVIVSTPTGYQMIPSAVGIVRGASPANDNEDQIGYRQHLNSQEQDQLQRAEGNLSATLTALSVSGNTTTISIQVNNTGSIPVVLNAIGVHGNLTAAGLTCTQNNGNSNSQSSDGSGSGSTTSTAQGSNSNDNAKSGRHGQDSHQRDGCEAESMNEIVFVPVNSTVSGTGCVALKMQLVTGDSGENGPHGLTLSSGQCVTLTFTGEISTGRIGSGNSGFVLVPSTVSGQVYIIHVIASQGANAQLSCVLPATPTSCSVLHNNDD
ncbi:MAG: DUF4382 domain-containing protein [Nitrososphaerota archaeon]|jgi:hypothetical protein|nr:DUF4382 domain-containing protein [Nitrososphaerota archaeon]MDG6941702.1 DUF4382 domain-containing protein [Nitrososphaerota archaeon]MDG6947125.1 DUF4382 domain-containing protein [Nitrososphaerota archaeon]MDG6951485.1 DUF4382 domain-containing protein [Nitrososphaerota archaeon]